MMGEFERVGQQVLDDLLQALGVGEHGTRQERVEMRDKIHILGFGHVLEGARDIALQVFQPQFAAFHHHGAGFDLRQVENVVDEHEQVFARAVDGFGMLGLFGCEVPLHVLGQLVGQDEQRIQWCAQFVRHVGKELGFVLGGERQLLGLFFQFLAGLFHFLVFQFHFLVLLGEEVRFFLQLGVGQLQLFLTGLQLLRQ